MKSLPLTALVLSNLGVIVFSIFGGWNTYTILGLYLIENIIIGALILPKMAIAKERGALGKSKEYQMVFFVAHYATFIVFHGAVLLLFVMPAGSSPEGIGLLFLLALALLAASHWISYKENFIKQHESDTTTAFTLMAAPYLRVLPASLALLLVAFLTRNTPLEVPLLQAIILLKLALDIPAHNAEHKLLRRKNSPETS